MNRPLLVTIAALATLGAACSSSTSTSTSMSISTPISTPISTGASTSSASSTAPTTAADVADERTFTAQVWADNWFSLYVNGRLVGEDSVPITTERSFNAETITFTASYPLTIAMVSKDYEETTSGLEYIGTDRQQMGDGGFIAQFTDTSTGTVVDTTGGDWRGLVINRGPLNADCVTSQNADADCRFELIDEPAGWTTSAFDDSAWTAASVFTAEQVGTKDGYDTIEWDPAAKLIWTSDLKVDNTILWRHSVLRAP